MTSLSQYMRAEEPDATEPAGFYIPGAVEWWTTTELIEFKRHRRVEQQLYVALDWVEEEGN